MRPQNIIANDMWKKARTRYSFRYIPRIRLRLELSHLQVNTNRRKDLRW